MSVQNLDCFGLNQKTFIVSGSTRGIGRGVALLLGQAKANVTVTYTGQSEKSKGQAEEVCALIEQSGGRALALQLDVSVEEACKQAIENTVKTFGALDGLVNNSGIAIDNLAMRYKADDWDKMMSINLKGAFLLSKAALRPLLKNPNGGSIVNMSSVVALSGNAGQAAYSASKSGLIGMSKSLALELASRQVRVNVVAPGFIETDMTHALNAEQKTEISSRIPLNCLGQVDDIAWATLYLLSPLSRYVTGQVLSVNGGLYM